MFNLKDKLNNFLDELEETEVCEKNGCKSGRKESGKINQ